MDRRTGGHQPRGGQHRYCPDRDTTLLRGLLLAMCSQSWQRTEGRRQGFRKSLVPEIDVHQSICQSRLLHIPELRQPLSFLLHIPEAPRKAA
jgi:hypothetical protein